MIATKHVVTLLIFVGSAITACSDGSAPPANQQPQTPVSLGTVADGARAASQNLQTRDLILNSTLLFKRLADIGLRHMTVPVPAPTPATTVNCADGGSYTYSGTFDNSVYTLNFEFNGCRERGYQYVNKFTVVGRPSRFSVTLGTSTESFNIFNFNADYTVLLSYLKTNAGYTMVSAGSLPNTQGTITITGDVSAFDYFLLDSYEMAFARLRADYVHTQNGNLDDAVAVTANGVFAESWAAAMERVHITLADFRIERTKVNGAVAPTVNYSYDDTSVWGRSTFRYTPASIGLNGIFDVRTPTPIRTVYSPTRQSTSGTVIINDTARAQYGAGGDVTITVPTDIARGIYPSEYQLMKVSDFAAMEQEKPALLGATSTASVTGSTMTVTLTWNGPAPSYTSTSDMDLHVKYYEALAPAAGDAPTWHMDWHQSRTYPGVVGSTCTDPRGLKFSNAFDLDPPHRGICDVGLDFDDRDGYGPEHITALKLPSGYYIVSVNSFALVPAERDTTLYLSLHIGDNIFGPYVVNSVMEGGGESLTNPAVWFRVADVRVNSDRSIDVLAPNTALPAWGH